MSRNFSENEVESQRTGAVDFGQNSTVFSRFSGARWLTAEWHVPGLGAAARRDLGAARSRNTAQVRIADVENRRCHGSASCRNENKKEH